MLVSRFQWCLIQVGFKVLIVFNLVGSLREISIPEHPHTHTQTHTHTHTHMYKQKHVHLCLCVCVRLCGEVRACGLCVCASVRACMYCVCVCARVCVGVAKHKGVSGQQPTFMSGHERP